MEEIEKTYSIEAGLLYRGAIRRFLERQKFVQRKGFIDFHEQKSLIDSNFLIILKGPQILVDAWISATNDRLEETFCD